MGGALPKRVLLIHPGVEERGGRRDFPPWGIIFVGQSLVRAGHHVKVVDLNGEPNLESVLDHLVEEQATEILGVTCKWGHAARRAERLLSHAAANFPAVRRVMGGPLAATLPRNSRIESLVDAILPGDGENAILHWIQAGTPTCGVQKVAQDADLGLCWPDAHHLFDLGPYVRTAERSDLGVPSLYVSGARGCVARCSFCYTLAHAPAGLREVPALQLAQGLKALHNRYQARGFYFVDDGLVSRAPWRRAFCAAMAEQHPPLIWGVDLRTAEATPTILSELWNGRCRALYMGLETASENTNEHLLHKGRTASGTMAAIDRALTMGFRVRASVVIGWPDETPADIERTLDAVISRPELLVDTFRYNPLPNTPLATRVAPRMGAQHIYTEYGADAPNLSACGDDFLNQAWQRLRTIASERG